MSAPASPQPPESEPRRTPLYEAHKRLGAKLIDFSGWMMPVSYPAGILEEHHATRRAVGVFDVSHMGEIHFRGPRAAQAVQRLVTNDVGKLTDGRALYTVACRPSGGIVDDLIVYRIAPEHFLLVVNAANVRKDHAWFVEHAGGLCDIEDASDDTALIAFQGPAAQPALQALTPAGLDAQRPFHLITGATVAGRPAWIARTGYTGEDGFEVFTSSADAPAVWDALIEAAVARGGGPVGLGARDTLRLEARLALYGNDLTDETTPLEAGLGWVVKPEAGDFIGKEALLRQRAEGVRRKLVGFAMVERGIPRHGYPIHQDPGGPSVGEVTSGGVGPTVGKNIGLGYVPAALADPGARLHVDCRGKKVAAEVVKGPFYRRAAGVDGGGGA
jgi:aminomethyltransferase